MRGGMGQRLGSGSDEKYNLRQLNRQAMRLLIGQMWGLKGQLLIAVLLTLVIAGANVMAPLLTSWAVDRHVTAGAWNGLVSLVMAYVLVVALEWLAAYWQTFLTQKVAYTTMARLRRTLFDHVMELDIRFHQRQKTGHVTSTIMNDVESIFSLISQGFIYFLSDMVTVVAISTALFLLNRRLALALIITMPITLFGTQLIGKLLRKAQAQVRQSIADLTAGVEQNVAGVKAVKSFSQEDRQTGKVQDLSDKARLAHVKSVGLSALMFPIMDLNSAIGLAVVIWQGGVLFGQGAISLGVLMAAIAYVRRVYGPLMDLSQIYTSYQTAAASLDRIYKLVQEPPALIWPEVGQKPTGDDFVLDGVSFSYAANPVLEKACLQIPHGSKIGIIGPSGAGKSTLARLIGRLYDPQDGVLQLGGVNLQDMTEAELRTRVQVVPQDTYLVSGPVWRNIGYGLPNISRKQVAELIKRLGLDSFFAKLPDGLNTKIGEGGETLSGGQRQAVAIARALLRDPEILILDEAASHLDPQTELTIYQALRQVATNKTLIIVTHRTTSLQLVDVIYEVKDQQVQVVNKEQVALAGW